MYGTKDNNSIGSVKKEFLAELEDNKEDIETIGKKDISKDINYENSIQANINKSQTKSL